MTKAIGLERAAEIVEGMPGGEAKQDTFIIFVEYFNLTHHTVLTIEGFALMCGFQVVADVEVPPEEP